MDGWWDAEELDEFFNKILRHKLDEKVKITFSNTYQYLKASLLNLQSRRRATQNVQHHYDIGQDLYTAMLDKRMVYTCALWDDAQDLDEAQEAKLDLVCRLLLEKKNKRILDVDSGWGSFAKSDAEK